MSAFEPTDVRAFVDVVDTITRRVGTYGFLDSVKSLVDAGEPDSALNYLANGMLGWRLRTLPDEFEVLEPLCHAWGYDYLVEYFTELLGP